MGLANPPPPPPLRSSHYLDSTLPNAVSIFFVYISGRKPYSFAVIYLCLSLCSYKRSTAYFNSF